MKQFDVLVREVWVQRVRIIAENAEQAKDLVQVGRYGTYLEVEYSSTLDAGTWTVEDVEATLVEE